MGAAADLASKISRSAGIGVLGPAPAPMARLRVRSTVRKSFSRAAIDARCAMRSGRPLASLPDLARRVTVDVDPVGML
jgi:primosomal protein N'